MRLGGCLVPRAGFTLLELLLVLTLHGDDGGVGSTAVESSLARCFRQESGERCGADGERITQAGYRLQAEAADLFRPAEASPVERSRA